MEPLEVKLFCSYLRTRNYSPHTIENYGRDLRLFFAPLQKVLRAVSWRDIEHFIQQQHQAQLAATTINRRLHALKHFFDYLVMERQMLVTNPVKPSHLLRQGHPLPKQLSQDQVRLLFTQITNPLDHALYLLMLRCGLRVSEVARLRPSDLDWEQQSLRIDQGKGRQRSRGLCVGRRAGGSPHVPGRTARCSARRGVILESEAPASGAVVQRYAEKDGTVCQGRGHQGQLSQSAPYFRFEPLGRRCGGNLDQGTAGACVYGVE
jgi:integrase